MLDGQPLDEVITTFGIRQLKFDPDHGLFVNGQPTKLKGVACIRSRLFGNAVRSRLGLAPGLPEGNGLQCHPHEPSPVRSGVLRPVRSTRLLVFDEAFDEWTRDWPYNFTENTRGKSKYGYHLYFNQWHETDLRAMLRRDRNHPSVVLYSIGNEIPNQSTTTAGSWQKNSSPSATRKTRPARRLPRATNPPPPLEMVSWIHSILPAIITSAAFTAPNYVPERARFPHRLCLGTETSSAFILAGRA